MKNTTETEMQELLIEALDIMEDPISSIETYEEAGVMTSNTGIVVKLNNGSEFQITIVKSR